MVVANPMTAIKENDLFESLFERTSAGMLLVNDSRRYVNANNAACELLGLSRDQLLELRIDDLVAPELRGQTEEMFTAFIADGSQAGPFRLRLPDGREIDTLYSAMVNIIPGVHLSIFVTTDSSDAEGDLTELDVAGEGSGEPLNDREREVLGLLALGDSYREIAAKLHLAPETVRNYTRSARAKLGARSRAHAITLALTSGQLNLSGGSDPLSR